MKPEHFWQNLAREYRDMKGLDTHHGETMSTPNGMRGYDSNMAGLFAVDSPANGQADNYTLQLTVANGAALGIDLFSAAHLDLGASPTGLVTPNLADYKFMLRFLQTHPAQLSTIQFFSSEPSSAAPLLSSMRMAPQYTGPFGGTMKNTSPLSVHLTAQDFQGNRAVAPVSLTLDTFMFLRLETDTNASGVAVTFTINLFFGNRVDLRKLLAPPQPNTVRPGGRGLAPVGSPVR